MNTPPTIDRLENSTLSAFVRGVVLLNKSQTRALAGAIRGCSVTVIAEDLAIAPATAKLQLSIALKKLNSPNILQAAIDLMRLSHLVNQLTPDEREAASALTSEFDEIDWGVAVVRPATVPAPDTSTVIAAPRPIRQKRNFSWRHL